MEVPLQLRRFGSLSITIGATIRIDMVMQEGLWPAVVDSTQVELVIPTLP